MVALVFLLGAVTIEPAPVTAQQCPPQQQCPPPPPPPEPTTTPPTPDDPPDNGGGKKKGGGQQGQNSGKSDRDGGRHGRDEGRPDLTTLTGGNSAGGSSQDAPVSPAPTNQQPLPAIINQPESAPDAGDPAPDTSMPFPATEDIEAAQSQPQWPVESSPPPSHDELVEDLALPGHSEITTAVEEQVTEALAPLDPPDAALVDARPTVEPAPDKIDRIMSIVTEIQTVLIDLLIGPNGLLTAPAPPSNSQLGDMLMTIHELIRDVVREFLPSP
ncbi:MAG: hypothetical protein QM692_14025 [Thermomicrobiales bacterium]